MARMVGNIRQGDKHTIADAPLGESGTPAVAPLAGPTPGKASLTPETPRVARGASTPKLK